jgi:hypothetical protein
MEQNIVLAVGISIIRSLRLRGGAGTAVWCIPLIGLTTLITTSIRWGLAFSAINGGVTIQAVHVVRSERGIIEAIWRTLQVHARLS